MLTPLFLVAGTFFPISTLPPALRLLAAVNPLYHCVQLSATPLSDSSRGTT